MRCNDTWMLAQRYMDVVSYGQWNQAHTLGSAIIEHVQGSSFSHDLVGLRYLARQIVTGRPGGYT
jgi:hypothetical protein